MGDAARARRIAAPILVAAFAVSFLASGVGTWLHRSTLDEDVWAEQVEPLGEDPAVQAALAAWTATELSAVVDIPGLFREALPERAELLAGPLSSTVTDWIADRVDRFFASDQFEQLWAAAATRTHDAAVEVLRGENASVAVDGSGITIDLVPVLNAVLTDVAVEAPALLGRDVEVPAISVQDAPDAVRALLSRALGIELTDDFGTITIDDGGKLAGARRLLRWFDALVVVSIALTVASGVAALVLSPHRRRTTLQLLGGSALAAVVVRRAAFLTEDQVLGLLRVDANRAAASAVTQSFIAPFTDSAAAVLWLATGVAFAVAVSGPYRWANRFRSGLTDAWRSAARMGEGAVADPVRTWAVERVDVLRIGGWVLGAGLLWFSDLSWLRLLLVAALVAAWQLAVVRVLPRAATFQGPPGAIDASGRGPVYGSSPSARAARTASERDDAASLR